jgi:hypothetical protein
MKNIHVLPTENPSRLMIDTIENKLYLQPILHEKTINVLPQNIYITSDEEIKVNEYYLGDDNYIYNLTTSVNSNGKKIVLTTNTELIEEGIQPIDDEFLEWFVNNPSFEFVEIERLEDGKYIDRFADGTIKEGVYENYKIIIPQEEIKRKIDTCYNFDMEIGCVQDICRCEQEEPKQETRVFGTKDDESFWYDKPKQGKLTTEPINKTKHKVIFNNKRHIGYFIMDIDGYYYFDSLIKSNGWWTSYSLRMVADLLDMMNKSYEDKLNQELSN